MKSQLTFWATCLTVCLMASTLCGLQTESAPAQTQDTQNTLPDAEIQDKLQEQVQEIGKTLDQSQAVQDVSAGILEPIYQAAEFVAFPAFYWLAFALMVAGVISFAGQLVFAKLLLLVRGNLNVKEIISDLLGLLISAVGLILTTQAATENSSFTESPVMVVSATVVGGLLGLVFYWWGQSQELDAARGAKQAATKTSARRGM